ncbi:transglycosylase SLT domain-containing protein [Streptomyces sp. NPDC001515]
MSANSPEIAIAYVSIVPEIQGFTRELRNQIVGPAGDAGAQAGEAAGGGLRDKLKVAAAAAGVAAGAVLAKGLADAIEQANVTNRLQAQLGATGKDAKRYGEIAGKLYSKGITENFEEGAEAIRAVVNAGLVKPDATNAQLESIATKMNDVATTFGTDMSMQTQAVSALMKNGLAKNAGEALDLITFGLQKLGPNAEDLLETFQEYPRQLQKLGLDARVSLGLFSQGLRAGARDTDIVADALKEFGIRSIDMSAASREAYKALGINAVKMEQQIAKGGAGARKGLQTVLDRLRAMRDPVERNAAAVGLFGTQAEDLGSALFKLDPSKATAALGRTGGAAKAMGDTLRSGPMQQIKVFQRTVQQQLVDVLGKYLIPQLLNVKTYGSAAFGWLKGNAGWLLPFASGVSAIALAVGVYVGAVKVAALVTRAWAAAQAAVNAVMAMSPVGLAVLALVGLAAALFVVWKRSETFRSVVLRAWGGIQTAALYAWNVVLKPVFQAIAAIVVWLYGTILKPIFGFIGGLLGVLWAVFKFSFTLIIGIMTDLAKIALWLWNVAIGPVFGWIATKAAWLYNTAIKPHLGSIMSALKDVGAAAKWLWDEVFSPVFGWIASKAKTMWEKGVKPAFNALREGVKAVASGFETAKNAIKTAWGKLNEIARSPVSFIVNTVYSKGIVPVWNRIAGAFGAPKLKTLHFASGGILPGYTPGRDVHLAALSGGEAVMRPEWTRAMGSGYINSMNAIAKSGGVSAVQRAMGGGLPAFKDGGIFEWVDSNLLGGYGSKAWDKAKAAASWLKDGLANSARAGVNAVVNPLLSRIPGADTGWGKAIRGVPNKMIDALFGYAKKADSKASPNVTYKAGAGVAQWKPVVLKALSMIGQPSSLLGTVLRRMNQESGGNPRAINNWDINARNGTPSKGLMQVIDPTFASFAGKLRSRGIWDPLANVYASMRYAMSRYGSLPAAYDRAGGYDSGGWLQPGATLSVNASGKPEPVFTAGQWSILSTLAARGAEGDQRMSLDGARLTLVTEGGSFEAYVDTRADSRIDAGLTRPAFLGRNL